MTVYLEVTLAANTNGGSVNIASFSDAAAKEFVLADSLPTTRTGFDTETTYRFTAAAGEPTFQEGWSIDAYYTIDVRDAANNSTIATAQLSWITPQDNLSTKTVAANNGSSGDLFGVHEYYNHAIRTNSHNIPYGAAPSAPTPVAPTPTPPPYEDDHTLTTFRKIPVPIQEPGIYCVNPDYQSSGSAIYYSGDAGADAELLYFNAGHKEVMLVDADDAPLVLPLNTQEVVFHGVDQRIYAKITVATPEAPVYLRSRAIR